MTSRKHQSPKVEAKGKLAQKAEWTWSKINSLGFFAAASAVAALTNVWIASRQADIAETQLTISQLAYRPQLAVSVGGFGFTQEGDIGANITFTNVGTIGIFDAGISAGGVVVEPGQEAQVWENLQPARPGVHLGPTEVETASFVQRLTPEQQAEFMAGNLRVVIAGRLGFEDDLGREHIRYGCAVVRMTENRIAGTYCATPKQAAGNS